MIAALALTAYAGTAAALGARLLVRARWVDRAPSLGILAWLALLASVVAAGFLAALALVVPVLPGWSPLARAIGADPVAVAEHYDSPLGVVAVVAALALTAVAAGRLLALAVATGWREARVRAGLRSELALAGRAAPDGTIVLTSPRPAAWCVPGRRPAVVVTTGALDVLEPAGRRLVVAHERRHLSGRHHAVVTAAGVLARAFAPVPVFAHGEIALRRLVELAADDVARGPAERRALARALVVMAAGPQAALSAGGATLARVERLGDEPGRAPRLAVTLGVALLLALPLGLLVAPGVEAAVRGCYPTSP